MNKPPQPITGPTSVPLPAPSPGLPQVSTSDCQLNHICACRMSGNVQSTNISSSSTYPNSTRLPMPLDSPLLWFLPPHHLPKWALLRNRDRYSPLYFISVLASGVHPPPLTFPISGLAWFSAWLAFCCNALQWFQSVCVQVTFFLLFPSLLLSIVTSCVSFWLSSQFAAGPRALHQQVLTPLTLTPCLVCVWDLYLTLFLFRMSQPTYDH